MEVTFRLGFAMLATAVLAAGCAGTDAKTREDLRQSLGRVEHAQPQPKTGLDAVAAESGEKKRRGRWMGAPLVSATPKLGTSVGLLVARLHYFDEGSRASKFAVSAQHTTTDSTLASLSAETSFGDDSHRLRLSLNGGRVLNEYDDYLGTGIPVENVENAANVNGRYVYRVTGNWLAGAQAVFTNYQVVGQSPADQETLDTLGITDSKSGGAGLILQHDTRDSDNRPTRGWLASLENMAYREWLGGDDDYDAYWLDLRGFWGHGGGHVFALRQRNQWSFDAPSAADSSVSLRGYKRGQYLGAYVSSVEAEERFRIAKRWGATLFLGLGCIYGNGEACVEGTNLYPSYGAGMQFVIEPNEGIVANVEYARGKGDNSGGYFRVGYSF